MSKLDPEVREYLNSARARTTDALAALGLAHIRMGIVVEGRPTEADRDVLVAIHEIVSDLQSAKSTLEWYIDGHAGEAEE